MPTLSIHIHALPSDADFETTDPATVEALSKAYPATPALEMAHDLASLLRTVGRNLWADRLEGMEEGHMVTVVISDAAL
jgi:hypothetical protein